MADKDKNAVVEVPEEGMVTVDVEDLPEVEASDEGVDPIVEIAPEPEKKKPFPRVKLKTTPEPASDEALAALQQTVKNEETLRKAAEATANAERLRADNAVRQGAQHQQEAKSAREVAEANELALINSGIDTATKELAAAKGDYRRAMEAGEFEAGADAQERMAIAAAELTQLKGAKTSFEAGSRHQPTTEGRVEAEPVQQQSVFDRYVGQFAPSSQAWLRAHPECVPATVGGQSDKNAAMMEGHWAALRQKVTEGSPDYYRIIEEHAGYRTPEASTEEAEEGAARVVPKTAAKRLVQPSAPVTRDPPVAPGQVNRSTRTVSLTKEQQDAAKISFPHLEAKAAFAQYARNLVELESEGKLGRLTH